MGNAFGSRVSEGGFGYRFSNSCHAMNIILLLVFILLCLPPNESY